MAEKLYQIDAYVRSFSARITKSCKTEQGTELILDRTAFYPTSGGQPNDTGVISSIPVIDVFERSNEVVHLLSGEPQDNIIQGEIDWKRRFDHMQQHTGQHVLSQAFLSELGASTTSFHLGNDGSTIDLELECLSMEQIEQVETKANKVVVQNLPVNITLVGQNQAESMSLRKPPTVSGQIRIIDIGGFDRSACGGTHVRSSGEIGIIKIEKWERHHQHARVHFLCGWRALNDYRLKSAITHSLADSLSVAESQLVDTFEHIRDELRTTTKALDQAISQRIEIEARLLVAEADSRDGIRIIAKTFIDRDPKEVSFLAKALVRADHTVALLGSSADTGRLIFARSDDLDIDMRLLLSETFKTLGRGGGGGTPQFAQGGGLATDTTEQAIEDTANRLRQDFEI